MNEGTKQILDSILNDDVIFIRPEDYPIIKKKLKSLLYCFQNINDDEAIFYTQKKLVKLKEILILHEITDGNEVKKLKSRLTKPERPKSLTVIKFSLLPHPFAHRPAKIDFWDIILKMHNDPLRDEYKGDDEKVLSILYKRARKLEKIIAPTELKKFIRRNLRELERFKNKSYLQIIKEITEDDINSLKYK